ncbi:hypothetical protein LUZ60_017570 [Juncus effusus]|nr:hypothetical protein LUZ60_017570 [Juncus effusus]
MEEMHEMQMAGEGDIIIDIETLEIESSDSFEYTQRESCQLEKAGTRKRAKTPKKPGQDRLQFFVQQRLNVFNANQPLTIFRVPSYLREKGKHIYEPRMVSIGPYYHGRKELRTMEEHKWRCLGDVLSQNTKNNIEVYLEEMRMLEKQARQCYSESVNMSSDKFVLMLLLDGCFILQYYNEWNKRASDTLFWAHWSTIYADLLLLGNQIPFFVIHKLASVLSDYESHPKNTCPVIDLIFEEFPHKKSLTKPEICCDEFDHLLHLFYKCMVPELKVEQTNSHCNQPRSMIQNCLCKLWSWIPLKSTEDSSWKVFPSATILHESGVTFKKKTKLRDMFDITFENGVIEMPLLRIEDATKTTYANLMAFEQSQCNSTTFTSYVYLLDLIIDTGDDIALLKQLGIIENLLETNEDAETFINQIGEGTTLDLNEHYFASFFRKVYEYSNSTWPKCRARLMHDYFSNPWTSISVFAAGLLFGLTFTQTYYTVYSAYHH